MRESILLQSSLRRAVVDTRHAHQNPWLFWSIELVTTVLGGILGIIYAPAGIEAVYTIVGGFLGAIAGIISIFIINLILAPYRQRNELRNKIIELEPKFEYRKQRAQLRTELGVLVIEGTEVLKGFKSVRSFSDAMPTEEFKIWREKGAEIFLGHKLNTEYSLWFRDVYINIADSLLPDYIKACAAGLDRLEGILNTLGD